MKVQICLMGETSSSEASLKSRFFMKTDKTAGWKITSLTYFQLKYIFVGNNFTFSPK